MLMGTVPCRLAPAPPLPPVRSLFSPFMHSCAGAAALRRRAKCRSGAHSRRRAEDVARRSAKPVSVWAPFAQRREHRSVRSVCRSSSRASQGTKWRAWQAASWGTPREFTAPIQWQPTQSHSGRNALPHRCCAHRTAAMASAAATGQRSAAQNAFGMPLCLCC